jgi:hypothetical protein
VFGYLSSFVIVIGAGLLVPAIIHLPARLPGVAPPAGRGRPAGAPNLTAAIRSQSCGRPVGEPSMMVAIAIAAAFRDPVVWVGQTLQADLFIGPGIRPRWAPSKRCRRT